MTLLSGASFPDALHQALAIVVPQGRVYEHDVGLGRPDLEQAGVRPFGGRDDLEVRLCVEEGSEPVAH